ncbi:MAG: PLP-dependent aminotransferase family protein [Burkholderiaceae bacterium]
MWSRVRVRAPTCAAPPPSSSAKAGPSRRPPPDGEHAAAPLQPGLNYWSDPLHSFWIEQPFCPGLFLDEQFPLATWNKQLNQCARELGGQVLRAGPQGGALLLREAIARHVKATRGVHCEPRQVVITDGTAQSLTLIGKLLTDPGDAVWMEDPCYWGASHTFANLGLVARGLTMDGEGARPPPPIPPGTPTPRLAYLTPSNQFPLGTTMSVPRREQWLGLARTHGTVLIEDDYDSDFRFAGNLPSLQGMGAASGSGNHVIYLSSFSKTMFPGTPGLHGGARGAGGAVRCGRRRL